MLLFFDDETTKFVNLCSEWMLYLLVSRDVRRILRVTGSPNESQSGIVLILRVLVTLAWVESLSTARAIERGRKSVANDRLLDFMKENNSF